MTASNGCPRDRSELVSVLEDGAPESLRTHVEGCDVCGDELVELRMAAEFLTPATTGAPSDRVRREALSYAGAQVRGSGASWPWWRAPAVAAAAAVAAVLSGTVAYARVGAPATGIGMPGPWTLLLAAVWSSALFLYAWPEEHFVRRERMKAAAVRAAIFVVLALLFPVAVAVELCAGWLGTGALTQSEAFWAFAVTASLYACLASAIASSLRRADESPTDRRVTALLFTVLAAPLVPIQAATNPAIAIVGGILGLFCGAAAGCRLR